MARWSGNLLVHAAVAAAAMTASAMVAGGPITPATAQDRPPANTLQELWRALEACWVPPPLDQSRPGMQITVLMSLKRNGELLGQPRITFEAAGATDDERLAYRVAVAEMLTRCTPLPLTDGLGGAIAGRPFTFRLIDSRKQKDAAAAVRRRLVPSEDKSAGA